jgi:hypothetical protein
MLLKMSALAPFAGLPEQIAEGPEAWRAVYDSSSPHAEQLPGQWQELTEFRRLLVLRWARAAWVPAAAQTPSAECSTATDAPLSECCSGRGRCCAGSGEWAWLHQLLTSGWLTCHDLPAALLQVFAAGQAGASGAGVRVEAAGQPLHSSRPSDAGRLLYRQQRHHAHHLCAQRRQRSHGRPAAVCKCVGLPHPRALAPWLWRLVRRSCRHIGQCVCAT